MRVFRLLALLALLLPTVAVAQEEPFFRLGVDWASTTTTPPDNDPDDVDVIPPDSTPNSPFFLSYPTAAVSLGQDIGTLVPQLSGDLSTTTPVQWFVVDGEMPEGLSLDTQTGAITGQPQYGGVVHVEIAHERQTTVPDANGSYYGFQARASVTINVAADYAIEVSPSSASFVYGNSSWEDVGPITVTAATNPPQVGGHWGIARATAISATDELEEPIVVLDPNTNASEGKFQFYYETANGSRVYSEAVDVDFTYEPWWDFLDVTTATYEVKYDYDLEITFLDVVRNQPFKAQPYSRNGAIEAPTTSPTWVPPRGTLPDGVVISATGAIKGTATSPSGSIFDVNVPARTADNRYGWSEIRIRVVDALGDDEEDWCETHDWEVEDPDNTHGCFEEPDPEYYVAYYPPYETCDAVLGSVPNGPYSSMSNTIAAVTAYKATLGEGLDDEGSTRACAYQEMAVEQYDLVQEWGGDENPTGWPPGWENGPILITFQICLSGSMNNGINDCSATGWGGYKSYGGYLGAGSRCNLNKATATHYFGVEDSVTGQAGYLGLWLMPGDPMPTFSPEGTDSYTIGTQCGYRFYTPPIAPSIAWPFAGY